MSDTTAGADRAEERTRIAALLTRYPALPEGELSQVHQWFRRGATALDLGLLASDPEVAPQYQAYRADHYDRITPGDYLRAMIFVAVIVAVFVGIAWLVP